MNFIFVLITLIFLCTSCVKSQSCSNVVRRPEIRELSSEQLKTFLNAIKQLTDLDQVNIFEQSCGDHLNYASYAHGVPAFFPWHREFLRRFELQLQKIDSSIILPYWDWSIDSQHPEKSIIFTDAYFGGNGRSSDNCVVDGQFANFQVSVPSKHCLKRDFSNGDKIAALYSPEALETILRNSKSYDQFHNTVEGAPHGSVHVNIGGNNGDFSTMYSPNDPIFYLHHAFIDLLWAEWQARNPDLANTYSGQVDGQEVSESDKLVPFGVPVSQVFDTRAQGYCYYYNRYGSNVPEVQPTTDNSNLKRRSSSAARSLLHDSKNSTKHNYSSILGSKRRGHINKGHKFNKYKVRPTDRNTYKVIRTPNPLPEYFIKMNNLNLQQIRQTEDELAGLVESLNTLVDFVPLAKII